MRIDSIFADLKKSGGKALMPFIAAGDPDLALTAGLMRAFHESGCQLCELGFPYSDPIADGPTIQAAFTRSLAGGVTAERIFDQLRGETPQLPTVAMLSFAIVHRIGIDTFVGRLADAGMDGLIVPDLPAEESEALCACCDRQRISHIQLITPTTRTDRIKRIVNATSGFIYYVSVAGVTGQRQDLPVEIADNLAALREVTDLPICVGFGISEPSQVRQLAPHCDGVIVGSAIVRRIESGLQAGKSQIEIANDVKTFCGELRVALS